MAELTPQPKLEPTDRQDTLFGGPGAEDSSLFVLQLQGIDVDALWRDDAYGPALVKGHADASLVFFEAAPALHYDKQPELAKGPVHVLEGPRVSLRRRANAIRWDRKVNLTVALEGNEKLGLPKQLNLTNCIRDPSYQRLHLASALLKEARCPSERCAFAELTLNGKYYGTYVIKPRADAAYFESLFPGVAERAVFRGQYGDIDGGASLAYRGAKGSDYFIQGTPNSLRTYEPRLGDPEATYAALARFLDVVHNAAPAESVAFVDALSRVFDVAAFLRTMAVINLIGAWDNYYSNAQNYFLHFDIGKGSNGPFVSFCAYDIDSGFGTSWPGQARNWHEKDILFRDPEVGDVALLKRVLQNPGFRNYYCDFMAWFLETRFTTAWIESRRTKYWQTLEHSVYLEAATPYGVPDTERPWTNHDVYRHTVLDVELSAYGSSHIAGLVVTGIMDFVRRRREAALAMLAELRLGQSGVNFDSKHWNL